MVHCDLCTVRPPVFAGGVAAADGSVYARTVGEVERKNGCTLAESAGDAGPEGMQRLLNLTSWDCDGSATTCVRSWSRRSVTPTRGVFIVDLC